MAFNMHGYRLTKKLVIDGHRSYLGVSPDGVAVFIRLSAAIVRDVEAGETVQFLTRYRALDCRSLIKVRDFWIEQDNLVLVTDLADGVSLKDRLRQQKAFATHELIPLFALLGEATDCLHRHGILHRDIRPSSLLLHGGRVYLDVPCRTTLVPRVAGSILFSPCYTAPEVLLRAESPQSDQYSLAASYVELRLGRTMFADVPGNAVSRFNACLQRDPDLELLPAGERAVLRKALAKDSVQRYPTCLAFVEDLQRAIESQGLS